MKELNFDFVKNLPTIWVKLADDRIIDIKGRDCRNHDANEFYWGYGHSFKYSEYMKTWSENPLDLYIPTYNSKYTSFRKYEDIEEIWTDDTLSQEQKVLMIEVVIHGLYGTLWGSRYKKGDELYHSTYTGAMWGLELKHKSIFDDVPTGAIINLDEERKKRRPIIGFVKVVGMPGPDLVFYELKDFGKSWGLKRSDVTGNPEDDLKPVKED